MKTTIINPDEVLYAERLWLLQFGATGTMQLGVWDAGYEGLEEALEKAADWISENAPGHITSEDEMSELYKEAAAELDVDWPPEDWEHPDVERVREAAEVDMTYTESGWLTSYEWWANEADNTTALSVFIESIEFVEGEDGLDDDDWESVDTVATALGIKNPYKDMLVD